ncbi:MAG: DUF983 domain-containing protein [Hyphomicrobiaceae bacterium]|nr:MAG: DUF983 domain-containing protein [Hyphomicrobiaceae bacterium]
MAEKPDADAPVTQRTDPWRAGLRCRCPRCGGGKLYAGFLNLAESCDKCGLKYEFADAGDGPAIFVMLIVGFIVCGAALWLEVKQQPPMWVHAALWAPLTAILVFGLLRPLKALLIALQFANAARLGRLDKP